MDRRDFLIGAAALKAAPRARLGGGTPLALVTADHEARIVAVDLDTGSVHRRIPSPAWPRSIEAVGDGAALVAHTEIGRLSLLDASTYELEPIAGRLGAPRYTAAHPRLPIAYVTDSARREVVVVDLRGRRVTGRVGVGGPARHVGIDRHATRLWVALGTKAETIAVLALSEPRRPRLVTTIRPPFLAHDIGFTPGGFRVWVTSGDRGRVAIYDARSGRLVRSFRADAPPQHVTFLGDRAFVTSGDDALLRVHALDGRLLRTVEIPPGSFNVQRGADAILTPSLSEGTLCVVTPRGTPVERLRLARSSHDACYVMRQ
jgi:DNA-binding beta-propeller fold protein YncE